MSDLDIMEWIREALRQGPGALPWGDPVGEAAAMGKQAEQDKQQAAIQANIDQINQQRAESGDPGQKPIQQFSGRVPEAPQTPSPVQTRRQKIDSRLSRAQEEYDIVKGAISGQSTKIENPDGTVTWEQKPPMGLDALNAKRAAEGKLPLTIQGTEDALKYAKGQEALQRRREAEQAAQAGNKTLKDVINHPQAGQPPQQQNQNLNRPGQNDQAGMFPGLAPTQLTNPETGQPVQAFARLGQNFGANQQGAGANANAQGQGQQGSRLPGGQNRWWTALGPTRMNPIMQPAATPGQTPGNMPMGGRAAMHPHVQQWLSTGGKSGIPPVALRQTYGRMQRQYQANPQKFKDEWQKYVEDNLPQQFHWMVQ